MDAGHKQVSSILGSRVVIALSEPRHPFLERGIGGIEHVCRGVGILRLLRTTKISIINSFVHPIE